MSGAACSVAIVGAGPYGLAAAAWLRDAGVDARLFGRPMHFWREQMPSGMLLRSRRRSSHIADPKRALRLDAFEKAERRTLSTPLSLSEFIEYGQWFQRRVAPDLDTRLVQRISPDGDGFSLLLEDGDELRARRVVAAAGLSTFTWRPAPFDSLPAPFVTHTADHNDLRTFAGQSVLVIGGGQSALESAALLHETGADVEVVARGHTIDWLNEDPTQGARSPVPLIHPPPTDVGGRLIGWIVAVPDLFRRMPGPLKPYLARRSAGPAGASWLRPRLAGVPITTDRTTVSATLVRERVRVQLDDGTERSVDRVLLGTGYRVDVARYGFLAPELLRELRVEGRYPRLGPGLESSVPGLHFLGAPAVASFGPILRFVVGTWYAAPALTRRILGKPQPPFSPAFG